MKYLKIKTMMLFVAIFGMGCATDPYTGQKKISKTAIGATAGAIVGAATSSKSDRKKGALIGAAAGGGLGYYMDRQERILREKLQGTGVGVTRDGDTVQLIMPGHLTFNTNSAAIQPQFYSTLNSVATVLKEYKKTYVRVSGHTDNVGSEQYNLKLSQQRATSVADYLIAQGTDAGRFEMVGYGESSPVASNNTAEGRSANRRVALSLVPFE